MSDERDPESILKTRLASGEIDADEYRALLALLREDNPSNRDLAVGLSAPSGRMLVEVDDIHLYEVSIAIAGQVFPITDVTSVSGKSSSHSINFIPIDKTSYVGFTLASGKFFSLSEDKVLFAPARHKAIRILHATLKQLTFTSRLTRVATLLRQQRRLNIFYPFFGGGEPVFLTVDGHIETPTRKINLKQANGEGLFGVGVESRSLGYSRSYNTEEVAIAQNKGLMGFIPRGALRFTANMYDTDVVNALLQWMAKPGNKLEQAN